MRGLWAVLLLALWLLPAQASAHGLRPGVLMLEEESPGRWRVSWTAPVDTGDGQIAVEVVFPEACRRDATHLDCATEDLAEGIGFEGLAEGHDRVMTLVRFRDGRVREQMVTAADPRLGFDEAPGRSAGAWVELGVHHILGGLDHVAFVLGLLLVVGVGSVRRLVTTITAFTVAHSLTLALAVTGVVTLASAPVEAAIAASVVLVAREATHDGPTLARRSPWIIALLFGLIHGLGFAGALQEQGLPEGWVGWSLLWFNVGVELGQLAIVLPVAGLLVIGRRRLQRPWLRTAAAYGLGSLGAWWFVTRTAAMLAA